MMDFGRMKNVLTPDELAAYSLRALYAEYGYSHFKMSKFEEYDLYARNKDFLIGDNVITFTDTDGRLLALKPDVTLSIIKNSRDSQNGDMKVYYNENVYRVSSRTRSFREIMQVGLECLGRVDESRVVEVLMLAKRSLDEISPNNLLEISHLDIVCGVVEHFGIDGDIKREIFSLLGKKNLSAISEVCDRAGATDEAKRLICRLASLYGAPSKVLVALDELRVDEATGVAIDSLTAILDGLAKCGISDNIILDFSVVNDMNYYNGIAFKGFVDGVPTGILSGGQYDTLMAKMGRRDKAIGFAVYLDELERLSNRLEA